jgi:uncharacterized protein (TIGR03435 family)
MRLFLSVFLAASALAQKSDPPAFDAASVKINPQFSLDNRATTLNTVDTTPGSLTIRNFNLAMIVAWAHHVQRPQVSGPAWIESQRYDIFANPSSSRHRSFQVFLTSQLGQVSSAQRAIFKTAM